MSRTVQAAVIDKKQSIVMREDPYPEVTADSGVLKVEATGIGGVDYEVYQGLGAGSVIPYPFIPGHVIVGRVDALGARAAERWGVKEGDRVVLNYTVACGECGYCRLGGRRRCLKWQGYGRWFDFDAPP